MLEAVRRQLSVLTDLLDRQIDASEATKATDTLRDILESQKRHLHAIIDVIETQQREEQDKFERIVNQTQENTRKNKLQTDRIRSSIARLQPPTLSPMLGESSDPVKARSVSPARRQRSVSPAVRSKQRTSLQVPSRSPKRRSAPPGEHFDPQLSALEGLQRKLARQVNELQGLAIDDPVARAVSQSLHVEREDKVRFF
jgi:hypothetical protein